MKCYNCGCRLAEYDFCTSCGADVSLYKRIMFMSNRFYNDGLERATVRDLTGAIMSLRQSLKFNKNNIEARNLLGLVYFEMGEVVAALSEWVISKNIRPKKNIADDYIDMIQANAGRLDSINQTIKKYNQALAYCMQDSLDLAVIQLKKVLSLNPKYVRAHQLLALLYINAEEWDKARKELNKCTQIDANNTITLRYLKEVNHASYADESPKSQPKSKSKALAKDVIQYQSGNETIIQPVSKGEGKGISTLVNIAIGIAIGIAAVWFLILPARVQLVKNEFNSKLQVVSEQSDAKSAQIDDLNQKMSSMESQNAALNEQLEAYAGTNGTISIMDELMSAAIAYMETPADAKKVAEYLDAILEEVDLKTTSPSFRSLYQYLLDAIGPTMAAEYYTVGYEAYRQENYREAIKNLEKVVYYDRTNGDALYYLGNSYRINGEKEKAKDIYEEVIASFPGTEKSRKSQQYLEELQ